MSFIHDRFDLPLLIQRFFDKFGDRDNPPALYFAPGRVNLIGDHTDYTGGLVFPCGIDRGSLLLMRRTRNDQYRFASTNFDLMAQLTQAEIGQKYGDNWINYPLAVVDQFRQRDVIIDGMDCLFSGNVPNGAGLSSSASIEVVTAFAINEQFQTRLPLLDLVKLCQAAENEFVGMQCGIMDQFAVAMARHDHAIMLNCSTLEHRQVPLQLGDHAIVLANTNQRRELAESAYNDRVAECNRALSLLGPALGINELSEVSGAQLRAQQHLFVDDDTALRRARHIITENDRVKAAIPALESGDLQRFGQLMNESHDSLKDDFNVSSEPLDQLVALARQQRGVLGSRLTGAGFGGCTVNLVRTDDVAQFERIVGTGYQRATGLSADFYTIYPGGGVQVVES